VPNWWTQLPLHYLLFYRSRPSNIKKKKRNDKRYRTKYIIHTIIRNDNNHHVITKCVVPGPSETGSSPTFDSPCRHKPRCSSSLVSFVFIIIIIIFYIYCYRSTTTDTITSTSSSSRTRSQVSHLRGRYTTTRRKDYYILGHYEWTAETFR